jgi:collagenase-like PrtC family protease
MWRLEKRMSLRCVRVEIKQTASIHLIAELIAYSHQDKKRPYILINTLFWLLIDLA